MIRLAALLACAGLAHAATLDGSFTFEQPPRVALVYFSEDTSLAADREVIVDQKDKSFTETLVVVAPGGKVGFRNSDDVQHNVYADDTEQKVSFDIGLANPQSVNSQPVSWGDGQVVRCGCKIHPKMQLWIAAIRSAFSCVVDFAPGVKGPTAFTLAKVPAQYSKVRVWIPRFDAQEVALVPGTPATVEFKRKDRVFGSLTLTLK